MLNAILILSFVTLAALPVCAIVVAGGFDLRMPPNPANAAPMALPLFPLAIAGGIGWSPFHDGGGILLGIAFYVGVGCVAMLALQWLIARTERFGFRILPRGGVRRQSRYSGSVAVVRLAPLVLVGLAFALRAAAPERVAAFHGLLFAGVLSCVPVLDALADRLRSPS